MKRKVFEVVTKPLVALFNQAHAGSVNLFERMHPTYHVNTKTHKLKFYCPNRTSLWRAKSLFTKEPDTIEWINNFDQEDILYDIGANVGMFSIYAATRTKQVFSFEPESQNYALLNRNIYINAFQEKINAFNIAISNTNKFGHLYLKDFTYGGALNNFDRCLNYKREPFSPHFKQGVMSTTLDDLIKKYHLPVPQHLKVDVDGLEPEIVAGASELLKEPALKSILIELNVSQPMDNEIIPLLKSYGFKLASRYHLPDFDHSPFKDIYNHIFYRS